MKRLTPEELLKIDALEQEEKDLQPARDRHWQIGQELYELKKRKRDWEKQNRQDKAELRCNYNEPIFPSMGTEGDPGSADFSSFEDAKELVEVLNIAQYRRGYFKLEWDGPGYYTCEPDYEYSRGDIDYFATFKKVEENE